MEVTLCIPFRYTGNLQEVLHTVLFFLQPIGHGLEPFPLIITPQPLANY